MEQVENLTQDDVLELIQDFPIKPRTYKVIVTLNMEEEQDGLTLSSNMLSESQYIVALSEKIVDLKAGQKVLIDLEKLQSYDIVEGQKVSSIKIKPIYVNNKVFGMINDNVIDAIDGRE